ncbi:MAG: Type secretion, TssG, partial [Pseudomonadota bacterium]
LYDFLKIFENRLFQLKYQIWKAGYPPFFLNSPNHPFAKLLRIISGGKLSDKSVASSYSIAGLLSNKPFSVMALKKICKVFIGFDVVIEEHCNQWVSVNSTIYGNMLGENCLLGKRYLESRKLFLIKIQCITAKNMQALYSDIALLKALDEMIQSSLTPNMRYKLYLSATQDFIPIALGNKQVRLGMGVMLGIRLGNGQLSICFN